MNPEASASGHGHRWWMVAAASVAVVGVGLLALTTIRDEPENPATGAPPSSGVDGSASSVAPATTAPPRDMGELIQDGSFPPVEPGAYVIDPDGDASTPLTVTYDVPAGWSAWPGAVKFYDPDPDADAAISGHVLLSITTVTNVVTDGCADHSPADPAIGSTVDDLATALAELAPFEVSSPPTDVTVSGYQGKYVQLTVPDTPVADEAFTDCGGGKIRSWIDWNNPGAFYGYNAEPGRIEEFWILDVDGTRLVIETNWSPASPQADVTEMRAIFDSIRIEPSSGVDAPASSVASTTIAPPRDMGELIQDAGFPPVEAGAYVIDPDGDASTPLTVTYDVPAGWSAWPGAVKFYGPNGQVVLTITTVTNVVTDGCADHSPADPAVGSTVDDLATALAELAPFEVSSPPTDVTVSGYQGKYVQLTVPDTPVAGEAFTDCDGGKIRSWIDRFNPDAFYGYNAEPGRIEEFWILDVDGTRLVIETNWSPASPEADVAEMRTIFDSIRIEP